MRLLSRFIALRAVDRCIAEKDMDGGVKQAFGNTVLNADTQNAELGYNSIEELTRGNEKLNDKGHYNYDQ